VRLAEPPTASVLVKGPGEESSGTAEMMIPTGVPRITAALPAPLRAVGPALRPNPWLVTVPAEAGPAPSCRVRQRQIR
jgi:hypothetical protein